MVGDEVLDDFWADAESLGDLLHGRFGIVATELLQGTLSRAKKFSGEGPLDLLAICGDVATHVPRLSSGSCDQGITEKASELKTTRWRVKLA